MCVCTSQPGVHVYKSAVCVCVCVTLVLSGSAYDVAAVMC